MSNLYNNPGNKTIINPYSPLDTYDKGPCGVGIQAPKWVGIKYNPGRIIPGRPNISYKIMCECNEKPFNYTVNDARCLKERKNGVDYGYNNSLR